MHLAQDAHGAGSGSRGGRGRGGAAAADDAPGSSKAEREKARRERLNERSACHGVRVGAKIQVIRPPHHKFPSCSI